MNNYSVVVLGGTGQVGMAVVKALLASPQCREIVMIARRAVANAYGERVRMVTMDTESPGFEQAVAALVQAVAVQPVYAASCAGIGSGSPKMSDEEILKLEVGVVGAFARGCKAGGISHFGLLSAAGASSRSLIRYARNMGRKEDTVNAVGFRRLATFRPGIIGGNANTPGYVERLGRFLPGKGGTIDQDAIGRAFVREFERGDDAGTAILHNKEMRAA